MGGLTRTPLSMLEAKGDPGSHLKYSGQRVFTERQQDINNSGLASATFDDASGVLTLTLVNGETMQVRGFMTTGNIGTGPEGPQGLGGVDGTDGLLGMDGLQGPPGCQGPPGARGATGPRGAQGPQGELGPIGPTGATGPKGDDGQVDIWIQTEDPGAVGAGALWVRP